MKDNKIRRRGRFGLWTTLAAVAAVALLAGAVAGYGKARSLCSEPCVVTDMSEQVRIVSDGRLLPPEAIASDFGLRVGVNLAEIDFGRRREEILRRRPALRSLSVTRIMPDRVLIRAEERTPAVRLGVSGRRGASGKVADAEGAVFERVSGTRSLPLVREARAPGTAAGQALRGRARAALDLVLAFRDPAYSDFAVLEVDTSKQDFLLATLGDYSRLKICWEGMDEPTPASRAALAARLETFAKSFRARCDGLKAVVWNATLPDYVFADTQEKP